MDQTGRRRSTQQKLLQPSIRFASGAGASSCPPPFPFSKHRHSSPLSSLPIHHLRAGNHAVSPLGYQPTACLPPPPPQQQLSAKPQPQTPPPRWRAPPRPGSRAPPARPRRPPPAARAPALAARSSRGPSRLRSRVMPPPSPPPRGGRRGSRRLWGGFPSGPGSRCRRAGCSTPRRPLSTAPPAPRPRLRLVRPVPSAT